jgi:hypothetical protein
MAQSYASHAHHPIPTYVASALALLAIITLVGDWAFAWNTLHLGVVSLSLAVAVLVSMSRSYITKLQDRIILLEMKVRCAEMLPAGQDGRLAELSPKQIVALRFASDAELGSLLDRAIRERLSPPQIKQAIQQWRPDHLRT